MKEGSALSRSVVSLPGFKSIHDMNLELDAKLTSRVIDTQGLETGCVDDYNLAKAETLLKDEALTSVLDTTLRIGIADTLYIINEHGTFFIEEENAEAMFAAEEEVKETIQDFENLLSDSTVQIEALPLVDENVYQINERVKFVDTFGRLKRLNGNLDGNEEITQVTSNELAGSATDSYKYAYYSNGDGNTSYYGLKSFKWKNRSVWQKIWDEIRDKDVSKENNFNDNLRCQVECFQVDYKFYASSGFKIKLQKKKKFLFITYWKETQADELVMGIEHLSGSMNLRYNPQSLRCLGIFTSKIGNYVANETFSMVYSGMSKVPILGAWSEKALMTVIFGQEMIDKIDDFLNFPYNYSPFKKYSNMKVADFAISGLRSLVGEPLKDVGRVIKEKEPKVGLHFGSSSVMDIFVADGVESYGSRKSKTVRFSQSAGATFIVGGGIIGYIPEEFDLKDFSMFGAVKKDGEWRGVRFTN